MTRKLRFPLILLGSLVFFFLFYKQSLGYNALIYSIFVLISSLLVGEQITKRSFGFYTTAISVLLSSFFVSYHASVLVIVVWIFTLIVFQAFLHWNSFRTPLYAFLSSLRDYFSFATVLSQHEKSYSAWSLRSRLVFKWIKLAIIPAIFFIIFYFIYKWAVPEFSRISGEFLQKINDWFLYIFHDISFVMILFIIWAIITTYWLFSKQQRNYLLLSEQKYNNDVQRLRNKQVQRNLKPSLKNEFRSGMILLISVNILLFIVNAIDILTIWFGFDYTNDFDLKQFVHEGTYLLILSIMLSMAIMLYFFRQNLNFYPAKKAMQLASFVWIFQNFILLVSVVIRNLHYIHYFGLAYLRIGLFFFLTLVVFGLFTLALKILNGKSLFYLIRLNSWAFYIGFVVFAAFDWDMIIAKHNLNHEFKNNMETSFLLTMDEKIWPLLHQHSDVLNQDVKFNTYRKFDQSYKDEYEEKLNDFILKYSEKTWVSKNRKDQIAFDYFKESL
jgi:uncharacterized protein YeeX (DUF496 family)